MQSHVAHQGAALIRMQRSVVDRRRNCCVDCRPFVGQRPCGENSKDKQRQSEGDGAAGFRFSMTIG
ncbi:MAG: hypothetical protein ACT6RN_18670 [Agrobacterium sp.]|uniref:hypothetical protein n=1 Tax=Agrobacterium sp. TaxID=361 RepID=UPI0040376FFB